MTLDWWGILFYLGAKGTKERRFDTAAEKCLGAWLEDRTFPAELRLSAVCGGFAGKSHTASPTSRDF
jgi:hypothetical protein